MAITADSKRLVVADRPDEITVRRITNLSNPYAVPIANGVQPYLLAAARDPACVTVAVTVLTPKLDSAVYFVDIDSRTVEHKLTLPGIVKAIHKDQAFAYVHRETPSVIICRDMPSGKELALASPGKSARLVRFSPDGSVIFALSDTGVLTAWDYPSARLRWQKDAGRLCREFQILPDKSKLVVSKAARLWDLTTGNELGVMRDLWPRAIHPSSKYGIELQGDHFVFKRVPSGQVTKRLRFREDQWSPKFLLFTPDGSLLVGAPSSGEIRAWKAPDAAQ